MGDSFAGGDNLVRGRRRQDESFRAPAALVFLGTTVLVWRFFGQDPEAAVRQTLDALHPTLEAFFTSHLLHTTGFHLTASVFVVLVAGGILETRWGTPRFLVFYGTVVILSTGVSLVAGRIAVACGFFVPGASDAAGAFAGPVSYGSSALALACLVAVAGVTRDRVWLGFFPVRRLLWALIVLGAAGLALLDSLRASGEMPQSLFLLPQISGVMLALLWLRLDSAFDRKMAAWLAARDIRERERVREIRHRVDELLDKISSFGYDSLTAAERSFLRHSSKHFKSE